ncbi:lipopolysaccharide biosynthesis protein [Sphingomonas sp.]|uniref:lipopolysaccharide biosynthesis protein n=1 Tax=Sphingomonas sp. TaxID=28214 RepID=UPI0035BC6478
MLAGSLLLVAAVALSLVVHSLALLIAANIASMLIPAIAYVRHLSRNGVIGWASVRRVPRWGAIKAVLAIGLPGLGVTAIYATMNWLAARALVEHQVSPDQFNQFGLGMQWFALVLFIPLAFGQVLFPRFVRQAHTGALRLGAIVKPAGFTFAVVLACAMAGAICQPLLTHVYGPQYDFPRLFVFTILVAAAFGGAVNLLGSYVMAIRGTGTWFGVNLVSLAVGLPVIVWAPPTTAFESARLLCLCYAALTLAAIAVIWRHRRGQRVVRSGDVSPHADAMLRQEMDYPPAI